MTKRKFKQIKKILAKCRKENRDRGRIGFSFYELRRSRAWLARNVFDGSASRYATWKAEALAGPRGHLP